MCKANDLGNTVAIRPVFILTVNFGPGYTSLLFIVGGNLAGMRAMNSFGRETGEWTARMYVCRSLTEFDSPGVSDFQWTLSILTGLLPFMARYSCLCSNAVWGTNRCSENYKFCWQTEELLITKAGSTYNWDLLRNVNNSNWYFKVLHFFVLKCGMLWQPNNKSALPSSG